MRSTTVFLYMIISTIGYTQSREENLSGISENDDRSFFGDEILLTQWDENDEIWRDEKVIPVHESPQLFFKKLAAQYDFDHVIRKREAEESILPEGGSGDNSIELEGSPKKEQPQSNTENKDKLDNPVSTNHSLQDTKPSANASTVLSSTTKPVPSPSVDKEKADTLKAEETDKVELPKEKVIPAPEPKDSASADATTKAAISPIASSTVKSVTTNKVKDAGEAITEQPLAATSTSKPIVSTPNAAKSEPEKPAAASVDSPQKVEKETVALGNSYDVKDAGETVTEQPLAATSTSKPIVSTPNAAKSEPEKPAAASVDSPQKVEKETVALGSSYDENPEKRARKNQEPLDNEQSGVATFDNDSVPRNMEKKENYESLPADVKAGESSEKTESARTDSKLLIFLGVTVVTMGVAAFTYNYIKKRKQRRHQEGLQNGGPVHAEDPEAGKELKPLMKSGDKSARTEDSKVEIEDKYN